MLAASRRGAKLRDVPARLDRRLACLRPELRRLPGIGQVQNYVHAIPLLDNDLRHPHARRTVRQRAVALRPRLPTLREKAVALARERGAVTTKELQAVGVHRCYLRQMCEEGLLTRVGHGRYIVAERDETRAPIE